MVAQAGEIAAGGGSKGPFSGISTWGWIAILGSVSAVGAIVAVGATSGGGDGIDIPVCP